ncbi:hypothetical protein GALL_466500 [mine drainage metagenome]|uniref:Uncharacterized protein n=1 Tax=mine drainage metagenome TaxID=410659 RepID=A0A1J5Q2P9_9ZZZZ
MARVAVAQRSQADEAAGEPHLGGRGDHADAGHRGVKGQRESLQQGLGVVDIGHGDAAGQRHEGQKGAGQGSDAWARGRR